MSENERKVPEVAEEAALSEEDLEKLSGGYLFTDEDGYFVLVDWAGKEVAKFDEEEDAEAEAERRGFSTDVIPWYELKRLRRTGSPYL